MARRRNHLVLRNMNLLLLLDLDLSHKRSSIPSIATSHTSSSATAVQIHSIPLWWSTGRRRSTHLPRHMLFTSITRWTSAVLLLKLVKRWHWSIRVWQSRLRRCWLLVLWLGSWMSADCVSFERLGAVGLRTVVMIYSPVNCSGGSRRVIMLMSTAVIKNVNESWLVV